MPVVQSSRQVIYIPTSEPSERVFLLKSKEELEELDEDDVDITVPTLLDHYIRRPIELEDCCLAKFAAWYEFSTNARKSSTTGKTTGNNDSQRYATTKAYTLLGNKGCVRERTKAKVIRCRGYKQHVEPEQFYREQLMLYKPWRNEGDIQKLALTRGYDTECSKPYFIANRQEFDMNFGSQAIEDIQAEADAEMFYEDMDSPDINLAELDEEYRNFFMDDTCLENAFVDETQERSSRCEIFKCPNLLDDNEYTKLVQSLNQKQLLFFQHVMRNIRCREHKLEFVSGPAGTGTVALFNMHALQIRKIYLNVLPLLGKSHLIKAIDQAVNRYYRSIPGKNLSLAPVIRCAPTGILRMISYL